MEYTFGMQVPQATGNVQSQAEPDRPGQVFRGAEELFQGPPIHILGHRGEKGNESQGFRLYSRSPTYKPGDTQEDHKGQKGQSVLLVPLLIF